MKAWIFMSSILHIVFGTFPSPILAMWSEVHMNCIEAKFSHFSFEQLVPQNSKNWDVMFCTDTTAEEICFWVIWFILSIDVMPSGWLIIIVSFLGYWPQKLTSRSIHLNSYAVSTMLSTVFAACFLMALAWWQHVYASGHSGIGLSMQFLALVLKICCRQKFMSQKLVFWDG